MYRVWPVGLTVWTLKFGKNHTFLSTRSVLWPRIYRKCVCGRGFVPDPTGGSSRRSPRAQTLYSVGKASAPLHHWSTQTCSSSNNCKNLKQLLVKRTYFDNVPAPKLQMRPLVTPDTKWPQFLETKRKRYVTYYFYYTRLTASFPGQTE